MAAERSKTTIEANDIKDEFNANEIIPGLWLGNLADAENPPDFITHIITVAARIKFKTRENICHSRFEVADHPCADILAILPGACNALDEALSVPTNAALVHCVSGVSRSATTVIAWLMTRKGMSFQESFDLARESRPRINPNVGFKTSLEALEFAKGDFKLAMTNFDTSNRERVLYQIGDLRDKANEYHQLVDEIENNMGLSGCGYGDMKTIETLEKLKQDIIGGTPQEGKTDDRVARTIRKSALQKVDRLLDKGI
mmetsp:Transcript_48510/g.62254  ORF Transcript_48510/g.62254 Transcript_48510/m.62254 type:complete len:257 (+) Transcript_48510:54-824(+)